MWTLGRVAVTRVVAQVEDVAVDAVLLAGQQRRLHRPRRLAGEEVQPEVRHLAAVRAPQPRLACAVLHMCENFTVAANSPTIPESFNSMGEDMTLDLDPIASSRSFVGCQ